MDLGDLPEALGIGRAVEVRRTAADRLVVDGPADGIVAAGVQARVTALLAHTSSISGAILVDHALRVAAGGGSVAHAANSIAAAR